MSSEFSTAPWSLIKQGATFMNFRLIYIVILTSLSGCIMGSNEPFVESENQNSRVRMIVIDYTSENFADSLELLTKSSSSPVSSHYLLPEPNDSSYPHRRLKLISLSMRTDERGMRATVFGAVKLASMINLSVSKSSI